jgi:predicted RNA-binding Zn ribbon-like protein
MDGLTLANTVLAQRGRRVDTLDPQLGLTALRDAIRELFAAAATGEVPPPAAVDLVNSHIARPRLEWHDGAGPAVVFPDAAAEAAGTAMQLVAGGLVRGCGNPRCVQFFLADGHRAYCSPACGNRARVARHSARHPAHEA